MLPPPVTYRITPDHELAWAGVKTETALERLVARELKWRNAPEWEIRAEMDAALERRRLRPGQGPQRGA